MTRDTLLTSITSVVERAALTLAFSFTFDKRENSGNEMVESHSYIFVNLLVNMLGTWEKDIAIRTLYNLRQRL